MAKFFYIDQSLRSLGGHHFDNAINLLNAVEAQGYVPILATHRKFRIKNSFPEHWDVLPCFRHSSYSRYALCGIGTGLPPVGQHGAAKLAGSALPIPGKPLSHLANQWHRWRREAKLRHFAQSCEKVFARYPLEAGDHVFFPTVSEFDFLALSRFLQRHPAAKAARWHLQFHFGIFEGRPAEYEQQHARANWVHSYFEEGLNNTQGVDIRFYNTSQQLADQYNRIGLAEFQALPYPINLAMQPPQAERGQRPPKPLRVTCGGGLRPEKGHDNLNDSLAEIWEACFASGQMQLQVQAKRSKWRTLHFPSPAGEQPTAEHACSQSPVKLIPHPLAMEDYIEVIRQSHIGLLMYDSRRYYARRAGVLCEFLCAGVPVIVPAGCWLSEQIAEAGFEHLDRIVQQHRLPASNRPDLIQDVLTTGQPTDATFTLDRPAGSGDLVIGLHRSNIDPLTYVRMTIDQCGSDGENITSFSNTVGRRAGDAPAWAMWRIAPQTRTLRLTLHNAYDNSAVPIDRIDPVWLEEGTSLPLASVGLIAADEQHVGRLLLEMRDHYDHYRQSALAFSDSWRRSHDPRLTAATLMSSDAAALPLTSIIPATSRATAA